MLESVPEVEKPIPETTGEVLDLEKKLALDSYFDEDPALQPDVSLFDMETEIEPVVSNVDE